MDQPAVQVPDDLGADLGAHDAAPDAGAPDATDAGHAGDTCHRCGEVRARREKKKGDHSVLASTAATLSRDPEEAESSAPALFYDMRKPPRVLCDALEQLALAVGSVGPTAWPGRPRAHTAADRAAVSTLTAASTQSNRRTSISTPSSLPPQNHITHHTTARPLVPQLPAGAPGLQHLLQLRPDRPHLALLPAARRRLRRRRRQPLLSLRATEPHGF